MQETEFAKLFPVKSVLGREFLGLQRERDKQEALFSLAVDKMAYETSPLRRANLALVRFIQDWLPRIEKANLQLTASASERLTAHHLSVLSWEYGEKVPMDRRSEATIWMHQAISRLRSIRPAVRRAKMYHPHVFTDLLSAFKTFRSELRLWKYARVPFDGSQAMNSFYRFLVQCDLLGVVND